MELIAALAGVDVDGPGVDERLLHDGHHFEEGRNLEALRFLALQLARPHDLAVVDAQLQRVLVLDTATNQ